MKSLILCLEHVATIPATLTGRSLREKDFPSGPAAGCSFGRHGKSPRKLL
ncbi:hypothetical protein [Poriferisphaera corsica]|nr:hypothetical protein [Poriferisphaera corsica]